MRCVRGPGTETLFRVVINEETQSLTFVRKLRTPSGPFISYLRRGLLRDVVRCAHGGIAGRLPSSRSCVETGTASAPGRLALCKGLNVCAAAASVDGRRGGDCA